MRVDDSRIRKEKVADSKISGYVWTGPKRNNCFAPEGKKILASLQKLFLPVRELFFHFPRCGNALFAFKVSLVRFIT